MRFGSASLGTAGFGKARLWAQALKKPPHLSGKDGSDKQWSGSAWLGKNWTGKPGVGSEWQGDGKGGFGRPFFFE